MTTKTKTSANSDQLVDELLRLAEADFKNDRRSELRYPFFRPVSVQVDNHNFSAFTREISTTGVGLLHNMELPLQEVLMKFGTHPEQLRLRIERCDSIGEGWYISGGKLVGIDS